jgi:hypothetical protein
MTRATEMIAPIEAIPFIVEGHQVRRATSSLLDLIRIRLNTTAHHSQATNVATAADLAHPPQLIAMSRDLAETIAIVTTDVVSPRPPPTLIDMFLARRLAPPAMSQSTHWPILSSSRTRSASHILVNGGE